MRRLMLLPLCAIPWLACAIEEVDDDRDVRPRAAAEAEVPVCDPAKTLENTSCRMDLSGVHGTAACTVVDYGFTDGWYWVTARNDSQCACEFTPPGKVGNQTASCGDLDPNYDTPIGSSRVCALGNQYTSMGGGSSKTSWDFTYEDAASNALALCEAYVISSCTQSCAFAKANNSFKGIDGSFTDRIPCCVPRQEEEYGSSDESGEPPPDVDTTDALPSPSDAD